MILQCGDVIVSDRPRMKPKDQPEYLCLFEAKSFLVLDKTCIKSSSDVMYLSFLALFWRITRATVSKNMNRTPSLRLNRVNNVAVRLDLSAPVKTILSRLLLSS